MRWDSMSNNLSVGLFDYRKLNKGGLHNGVCVYIQKAGTLRGSYLVPS